MPERHFFSKRYRLHNKPPNFQAFRGGVRMQPDTAYAKA